MSLSKGRLAKGISAALLGTVCVALVLSYMYPVIIGGADAPGYFASSLRADVDGWRLVLAVFLVTSTVTVAAFLFLTLFGLLPLLRVFPRLADAGARIFVLLGIGASLLVFAIGWVIQASFGVLADGDVFFMRLIILIDGPVGMLILWMVVRNRSAT